ncbi:MAG: alpha/beta fold hydrolase [Myxococcaceae bacterium]
MRSLSALIILVSLATGCAGFREKPDPPHHYYDLADNFVTLNDPALYAKPIKVRFKEAGSGPVLFLVHGLQTSSYSWRYNIEELGKKHHVIAMDLVGSGLTDHPADFGYSPEHVADFLEAFRAELAKRDPSFEKIDLVGNSLGGAYSAVYAAKHPERLRKLVIIHAPAFIESAPFFGLEQMRKGRVPEFVATIAFGEWMVRDYLIYYRPNLISEEEVAEYARPYQDGEGRRAFWHIVREGLAPEVSDRLTPVIATIKTPTLLIWAEKDSLIAPWTGHRWNATLPGSKLVWIPESSHFPHVEAPAMTMGYIEEFIGSGTGSTSTNAVSAAASNPDSAK